MKYTEVQVESMAVADVLMPVHPRVAKVIWERDEVRLLDIKGAKGALLIVTRVWHDPYEDYADGDLTLLALSAEQVAQILERNDALHEEWEARGEAYAKAQEEGEAELARQCEEAQLKRELDPYHVSIAQEHLRR